MKNIFEKAFLKLDKYLTDELGIMLIMIFIGILLGKLGIALLSIILI